MPSSGMPGSGMPGSGMPGSGGVAVDVTSAISPELRAQLAERPLYVVGGRQRAERSLLDRSDGWYGYGLGVILRLDGDGVTTVLEYHSRPGTYGPDDAVLFKSASRVGDRLYCCTQTEVVVFTLPEMREVAYISLPIFNDVHHVMPTGRGTLLVAVSGLELVVEVDLDGNVIAEHNVLGADADGHEQHRIDRTIDYRNGVSTKPHRAHPNHLIDVRGEPFVTRFEMRDAISLRDPSRRIDIGGERVHDGDLVGSHLYFTTVDGQLVVVDADSLEVVERHALRRCGDDGEASRVVLGWCRAVHVEEESCWVGFTRIRPTKLRQTVSWIRTGGAEQAPTRIARYRRSDWTCDAEIDLEPYGLNAVFSVLPA
jgi:hypothetical protein